MTNKRYSGKEAGRITENINLILNEARVRFDNQNQAWADLDKKVFYLLSFVSIFVGYIVVNNLLNLFVASNIHSIFKIALFMGLCCVFIAGYGLLRIVLPTDFKTGAKVKDLLKNMRQNKLVNIKFDLISIYDKMNDHNEKRIATRAGRFKASVYYLVIGIILIILAKAHVLFN